MKSLNGKRIATIAAGAAFAVAAFAGAAVTGADSLKTLGRSDFVGNGDEPQYTIVVGTGSSGEGAAWDAVAAGNIAATIGNMLYSTGEAVTLDSNSLSTAAAAISAKTGSGSVAGAKAEFQITTPAGGVPGASMQVVSYINDFLDNNGQTTRNSSSLLAFTGSQMNLGTGGVSSGNPLIITYDQSNGLLSKTVIPFNNANEEEKLYVFSNPKYDQGTKQIKAQSTYLTYEAIFTDALPFCHSKQYYATSESNVSSCPSSDYITKSGTAIKFLGSDWTVANYDIGTVGSEVLTLGKPLSGTASYNTLNVGDSIKSDDGYTVTVKGVNSNANDATKNSAFFTVADSNGNTITTDAIQASSGLYKAVIGGTSLYLKVFSVPVANTNGANSGTVNFAAFSSKMDLSNGGSATSGSKINGGDNGNWKANLVIGPVSGQAVTKGISRIIVYNDNYLTTSGYDPTNLLPGQSQTLIDGLAQFSLTYNGINTDASTRDALTFQYMPSNVLNVNSTDSVTGVIKVHSDRQNAFAYNIAGVTGVQDVYVTTDASTYSSGIGASSPRPGEVYFLNSTTNYYTKQDVLMGSGDTNATIMLGTRARSSVIEYFYSSTGKAVIGVYVNMTGLNGTYAGTNGHGLLTFEVPEWTVDNKDSSIIDARDTNNGNHGAFYIGFDQGTGSGQFVNSLTSISGTLNNYVTYFSNTTQGELSNANLTNFTWASNNLPFFSDRGAFMDTSDISSTQVTIHYGQVLAKAGFTLSKGAVMSNSTGGSASVTRVAGDTVYSDNSGVKIVLNSIMGGSSGSGASQTDIESILSGIQPSVTNADVVHPLSQALVIPDSQASASGKYIVVGGAVVNTLSQDANLPLSKSGDSVISVSGNRIYVAGWTAQDTQDAANALVEYLNGLRSSDSSITTDTTATDETTIG